MKIIVNYEYDAKLAPHYFAKTNVNGEDLLASGDNWEHAKSRLKSYVADFVNRGHVPEPEEVEVFN